MLFEKIIELAKEHGWKQQNYEVQGISGTTGTNFYKKRKVLTVLIVEEGSRIYPNKDEIREMFGELENE